MWSLVAAETDSAKEEKLRSLYLSNVEWNNVILFLQILDVSFLILVLYTRWFRLFLVQKADAAQQAFSSDNNPSLHLVLPALEALHSAWTDYSKNPKYRDFIGPLNEGIEKITDYYNKTSSSNAFNLSMCELRNISFVTYSLILVLCSTTSTNEDDAFRNSLVRRWPKTDTKTCRGNGTRNFIYWELQLILLLHLS